MSDAGQRPSSIEGGIAYDANGHLDRTPATGSFVVAWLTPAGAGPARRHYVKSITFWLGDRRTMDYAHERFAEHVARHMLSNPPI